MTASERAERLLPEEAAPRSSEYPAFASTRLPRLTWYQATRHTYGGGFVTNGGSLEKLRVILGHSTTEVTMRYGHLVRGQFSDAERSLADVQFQAGRVLPLRKPSSAS